jgi:hypothetical protein
MRSSSDDDVLDDDDEDDELHAGHGDGQDASQSGAAAASRSGSRRRESLSPDQAAARTSVLAAIAGNSVVTVRARACVCVCLCGPVRRLTAHVVSTRVDAQLGKFAAFWWTGSDSILSEAIHSLADTGNQALLWLGIQQSQKRASASHPYGMLRRRRAAPRNALNVFAGYGPERFVWALISATGVFFMGCGFTVYHGLVSLGNVRRPSDAALCTPASHAVCVCVCAACGPAIAVGRATRCSRSRASSSSRRCMLRCGL